VGHARQDGIVTAVRAGDDRTWRQRAPADVRPAGFSHAFPVFRFEHRARKRYHFGLCSGRRFGYPCRQARAGWKKRGATCGGLRRAGVVADKALFN
jgi:hypothetical protein